MFYWTDVEAVEKVSGTAVDSVIGYSSLGHVEMWVSSWVDNRNVNLSYT